MRKGGEASLRPCASLPIRKTYAPGDTAHLSILSNVDNFHALVIATGDTVEFRKVIFSPGKSLTFDLPITTDAQPNLDVSVAFIRNDQLYQANQSIKVPPVQQQLQIDITPDKQVFQPQQTAGYDVFARDWQGKPVSADFSFGVVDEAIYSLYPDSSGDMVKKLYPDRYVYAAVDSSLQYYFSGKAGLKSPLLAMRQLPSAAGPGKAGQRCGAAAGAQGFSGYGLLVSRRSIPTPPAMPTLLLPFPTRSPPGGLRYTPSPWTPGPVLPSIGCWCARTSSCAWARRASCARGMK